MVFISVKFHHEFVSFWITGVYSENFKYLLWVYDNIYLICFFNSDVGSLWIQIKKIGYGKTFEKLGYDSMYARKNLEKLAWLIFAKDFSTGYNNDY